MLRLFFVLVPVLAPTLVPFSFNIGRTKFYPYGHSWLSTNIFQKAKRGLIPTSHIGKIVINRLRTKIYWRYVSTHCFIPESDEVPPELKDERELVTGLRYNMESWEILPQVLITPPLIFCKAVFNVNRSGQMVNYSALNGNIVPKFVFQKQPVITWLHDNFTYYTVAYICPDCPKVGDNSLVWMVANVPRNDVSRGTLMARYKPPTWETKELRRHVFVVYEQYHLMKFNIHLNKSKHRTNFSIERFAIDYYLRDPWAGNFMLSED